MRFFLGVVFGRVVAASCVPAPVVPEVTFGGRKHKLCSSRKNDTCGTPRTSLDLVHERPIVDEGLFDGCYPMAPNMFQRSLRLPGGERLGNLLHRLDKKGGKLIVAVIGGSVANGYLAGGSPSSKKFCQYLEHRFPKAHIELKLLANDGTDSFWFLANSEILARAEPDLVVLDYSSNDLFVDSASSAQMRAACEQIIRKTLILPKRPALLILSLFRRLDQSRDQYEFEDNVYARVAAAYNVTLVSYRSAVWPRFEEVPSSKFWNGHGVHPFWYIHQLIADLMAYACEVAMVSQKDLSPRYDVTTNDALGPPLFSDSFINSLDTCEQALTSYDHQNGNLKVAGRRGAASHWSYWDLRRGKEGWQFTAPLEATRNNKESQEQKSRSLKMRQPKPLRKAARSNARRNVARNNVMAQAGSAPGHPLLGVYEGISFEMNFSSSPGLVVTFLRSYENFGQAVVSIDGNEAQILEMLQIQREYRETCDRITRRGKNVLKPASLRHAKPCTQHLAGSLVDPWSLDGHWADNSSLASVIAFTETFAIKNDRYLRGNAAVPKNFKGPAVVVPDRSLRPFIQPGLHNVTISFVRSNDAGRSRFKIRKANIGAHLPRFGLIGTSIPCQRREEVTLRNDWMPHSTPGW